GMIMLMIGSSTILSWTMSYTKIPTLLANLFLTFTDNSLLILLLMNLVILVMGCVMDPTPIVLIFTPIFLPVAMELGINIIHFGVIMVFNTSIGAITPPVGPILFTGCRVANLRIEDIVKYLWPYFIALIILLLFVTFIPALSLTLPGWAGYL
ncbi:MAG: TRAP transporter large permease subunit, partial [Sedimentibacter sp.]